MHAKIFVERYFSSPRLRIEVVERGETKYELVIRDESRWIKAADVIVVLGRVDSAECIDETRNVRVSIGRSERGDVYSVWFRDDEGWKTLTDVSVEATIHEFVRNVVNAREMLRDARVEENNDE